MEENKPGYIDFPRPDRRHLPVEYRHRAEAVVDDIADPGIAPAQHVRAGLGRPVLLQPVEAPLDDRDVGCRRRSAPTGSTAAALPRARAASPARPAAPARGTPGPGRRSHAAAASTATLSRCSAARSCGVASSSQPPNTYGGLSSGTRPCTWSITKNGVPSGPPSGSFQRRVGRGTSSVPPPGDDQRRTGRAGRSVGNTGIALDSGAIRAT